MKDLLKAGFPSENIIKTLGKGQSYTELSKYLPLAGQNKFLGPHSTGKGT